MQPIHIMQRVSWNCAHLFFEPQGLKSEHLSLRKFDSSLRKTKPYPTLTKTPNTQPRVLRNSSKLNHAFRRHVMKSTRQPLTKTFTQKTTHAPSHKLPDMFLLLTLAQTFSFSLHSES